MIQLQGSLIRATQRGYVPDFLVRAGIRRLLQARIAESRSLDPERAAETCESFVAAMDSAPLALSPEFANEQHYELPSEFFSAVLGPHRKYSCGHWVPTEAELAAAEARALALTCEHAQLGAGQRVLELGCGWSALTLWMAERFPSSRITAMSNSSSQCAYVRALSRDRGLVNVNVSTPM